MNRFFRRQGNDSAIYCRKEWLSSRTAPGAEPGSAHPSLPLALRLAFARTWAFARLTLKAFFIIAPILRPSRPRRSDIARWIACQPHRGGRRHHLAKRFDSLSLALASASQKMPRTRTTAASKGRIKPEASGPASGTRAGLRFLKRLVERHDLRTFR